MKIRFDEEMLAKLRPPERALTYWDTRTPGLALKVSPAGNKVFHAVQRPREGGNPVWRKLGDWPGLRLRDARNACRTTIAEILATVLVKKPKERGVFEDLAEIYIEKYLYATDPKTGKYRIRSRKIIADRIRNHLIPPWRGLLGSEITREMVVQTVLSVKEKKPNTKKGIRQRKLVGGHSACYNLFCTARSLFGWLTDPPADVSLTPFIPANPVPRDGSRIHGLTKADLERHVILTRNAQIRGVWWAAEQIGYPYGKLVQVALLYGQRRSQFGLLRRDQVEDGLIFFGRDEMKMNTEHVLPLTPLGENFLSELPIINNSPLYFTVRGKCQFYNYSFYKTKLDQLSGVTDFRIHDLRRTVRTHLSSITPFHIAELIVAHKKQGMPSIYDMYQYLDEMRAALITWQTKLMQIVSGDS